MTISKRTQGPLRIDDERFETWCMWVLAVVWFACMVALLWLAWP